MTTIVLPVIEVVELVAVEDETTITIFQPRETEYKGYGETKRMYKRVTRSQMMSKAINELAEIEGIEEEIEMDEESTEEEKLGYSLYKANKALSEALVGMSTMEKAVTLAGIPSWLFEYRYTP